MQTEELLKIVMDAGCTLVGVADAIPDEGRDREYREWLSHGYHGSMSYLERHAAAKYHPQVNLEGCRSIIMIGVGYFQRSDGRRAMGFDRDRSSGRAGLTAIRTNPSGGNSDEHRMAEGRVAMYAWGTDYHDVLGAKLAEICKKLVSLLPGERFLPFVDATSLDERHYAAAAGLGFRGRNTLIITDNAGSWVFLGGILSSVPFDATPPKSRRAECPSGCRRCIEACPTDALFAPHRIDASKCISYLTIEHKGIIPLELRAKMKNWVFGCDDCQSVCPLNSKTSGIAAQPFRTQIAGPALDLKEVLTIGDDEAFRRRFAGSPVLRAKRRGLIRNACVAAANVRDGALLPLLRKLSTHADPVIAEHAGWAFEVLKDSEST